MLQLEQYRSTIHEKLSQLIRFDSQVAIFDFPNHRNAGDNAIWLGEEIFLRETTRARVQVVDSESVVRSGPPNLDSSTIVLIHGGGNFGDLYPKHQMLRNILLSHYRRNRVIQLPQSLHFQETNNRKLCSDALNAHPDFHLMVRDEASLEIAESIYRGPCHLCPDMAMYLGSIERPKAPVHPVIGLLRRDKERRISHDSDITSCNAMPVHDWTFDPVRRMKRITKLIDRSAVTSFSGYGIARIRQHLYHYLAKRRVEYGCDILCRGEIVVTDRLHAHILCTLMGIPHIVLDNSYHKIRNYRRTWATGAGICEEAKSVSEALDRAQLMLNT